ncbi:MAG: hypothetical protein GPOALKHO_001791 [Sodalis sp.]|uniref:PTS sugar transporter subunit IIC n=1 Tax=Sodalis sp. (in: enterobacteria) TaxID=1898979 RepID=UPI0038731833|nr:MAG: hypothetical protein GPOALKHO_001791 [Sodalis sp.]
MCLSADCPIWRHTRGGAENPRADGPFGFSLLIKIILKQHYVAYFIFGFIAATFLKLPIIAFALGTLSTVECQLDQENAMPKLSGTAISKAINEVIRMP